MKEINIIFELQNKENPYLYQGLATFKDNVIRYKDENSNVLFDIKRKIFIKKDNEKLLKIDFDKKILIIDSKSINFNIKIEVIKYEFSNNEINIIYKIDQEKMNLKIKITGGSYE